jgi:hypothetical protein
MFTVVDLIKQRLTLVHFQAFFVPFFSFFLFLLVENHVDAFNNVENENTSQHVVLERVEILMEDQNLTNKGNHCLHR